jgi:hypothetical protein
VADSRVYAFARQDEDEVISCIDLDSGKVIWTDGYPAPYTMNPAAASHGKGPKSTPVISHGRLFAFGISGIVSAYDLMTGKLEWRREFSGQYRQTSPLYGAAMSPLVVADMLVVHIGGHDSGDLTALDVRTGKARWSWKGDGPGYASPIVVDIQGTEQIVTQTQKHLVGLSASTGELLWSTQFTTAYDQNSVTPLRHKDLLIFSGLDKGTMAIRISRRAQRWVAEQVWHNDQVSMYMNSPIELGDLIFGLSHKRKGQYFGIEGGTGKTLWTTEGREGDNAAIIKAGDYIFILTTDAELIIARANRMGFEPLKKYAVAQSPTWAHPVVLANQVLIKDQSTLASWGIE